MAWPLLLFIPVDIAIQFGATAYQSSNMRKIADQTEKLQGEWALNEAYGEVAISGATAPGALLI